MRANENKSEVISPTKIGRDFSVRGKLKVENDIAQA